MAGTGEYVVRRSKENGQFLCLVRKSDGKEFGKQDPEYQEFVAASGGQPPPEFVFPEGHIHFKDVVSLVDYCKRVGIVLFAQKQANAISFPDTNHATFPDEGQLHQLAEAGPLDDPSSKDGITLRTSTLWVNQEMLTQTLPQEALNSNSDLRKIISLPIIRTFVYLDISDFSKFKPGQQLLVLNALVRMVKDTSLWRGKAQVLPSKIDTLLCTGDGYIFVFKEPMEATYFAAYLAYLIEVLVANKWLAIDFHFRMGVHVGEVYTFWDPGRNGWNYTGGVINGGNRVLSAVGKENDDMLYISGEVRQALMASSDRFTAFAVVLEHLHNRGRKVDKHGNPWRVFEVGHAAICQIDFPAKIPETRESR